MDTIEHTLSSQENSDAQNILLQMLSEKKNYLIY